MHRPDSDPDPLAHSWFSNPLDWPHIDRMILLAVLIIASPVMICGGLILMYLFAPASLNQPVALGYLLLQLAYGASLLICILMALKRRHQQLHWDQLECFIIFSYLTIAMVGGWLSGTAFSFGLLLLVLGVNIASPFTNIGRLKRAYLIAIPVFIAFLLMQLSGLPYAPLFVGLPYLPDGTPKTYWTVFQVSTCITTLTVLYIAMTAIERWYKRENQYREMSTLDGLTRLSNRRAFMERSELEFYRANRNHEAQLSCILLDIDHFKQINDSHGHPAGDAVLVQVAQLLMENARQYDEAGRYGGEEFVLLLPSTPLPQALQVAERLRSQLEATRIPIGTTTLQVTASFGVACFPGHGIQTIGELLKAADVALYSAKHAGRNRVMTASSK